MQAWEWALELRTELREFWLSDVGQRFGQGWSAYRSPLAQTYKTEPVHVIESMKLAIASPFYVTDEMTDLLIHAAETFPPTEFQATDLPLDAGFVLFAKPIPTIDVHHKPVPWRAFSWGLAGRTDDPSVTAGVHIAIYDHREEREGGAYWDEELMARVPQSSTLMLTHETPWAFGHSVGAKWTPGTLGNEGVEISEEAIDSALKMLNTIHAFWLLCWQRIGVPMNMQAGRQVRRRAQRTDPSNRPIPDVRVITLRRPKLKPTDEHRGGGVEYSHRFYVNGHWRRQWYPSEQRHKPKWIHGYVKGPEDRPFRGKDVTFLWRR